MSQSTKAWLLDIDKERYIVVNRHCIIQYIAPDELDILQVPVTKSYSAGVLSQDNEFIPVIDLNKLLYGHKAMSCSPRGVMLLAYQEKPGEPLKTGGITICATPVVVEVRSDMKCPIPNNPELWQYLAHSCITIENEKPAPILNIEFLFSSQLKSMYDAISKAKTAHPDSDKPQKIDDQENSSSGNNRDLDSWPVDMTKFNNYRW